MNAIHEINAINAINEINAINAINVFICINVSRSLYVCLYLNILTSNHIIYHISCRYHLMTYHIISQRTRIAIMYSYIRNPNHTIIIIRLKIRVSPYDM